MAKIEAPNKEYNGHGPGGAIFKDGVAETDDEAALNYYRHAGYTVDGETVAGPDDSKIIDPRDVEDQVVGTRLRDAAVDPQEDDFLAPINAGQANPHGPDVVSPEVHGSGPAGILPGVVAVDNLDKQGQREQEFAKARLLQKQSVVDASGVDVDDRGEIGLSDPGSAAAGRSDAEPPEQPADKPE